MVSAAILHARSSVPCFLLSLGWDLGRMHRKATIQPWFVSALPCCLHPPGHRDKKVESGRLPAELMNGVCRPQGEKWDFVGKNMALMLFFA